MKVKIHDIESCKKQLQVEVPRDILDKEIEISYRLLNNKISIKGFRKGKIPRSILEQRYSSNVQQEALEKVIPDAYKKAVQENKVKVVGQPAVEDVQVDDTSSPLTFTATVDVLPEIALKEYKGLLFKKKVREITEADIDRELTQIQDRYAEYDSVEDKPVENTDYLIIDLESLDPAFFLNENKDTIIKNHPVIVGSQSLMKEIDEGIVAMQRGEVKEIDLAFPATHPNKDVAGRTVRCKVTVNEIKKKRVRSLDDAFAKDFAKCDTLAELKIKIHAGLESMEKRASQATLEQDIMNRIITDNPFEVPLILIDEELDLMTQRAEKQSAQRGQPFKREEYKNNPEATNVAKEQVKGDILMEYIAEAEQIEISGEEIDSTVKALALQNNIDFKTAKGRMKENGSLAQLEARMKLQSALKFIIDNSTIEEISVEK